MQPQREMFFNLQDLNLAVKSEKDLNEFSRAPAEMKNLILLLYF